MPLMGSFVDTLAHAVGIFTFTEMNTFFLMNSYEGKRILISYLQITRFQFYFYDLILNFILHLQTVAQIADCVGGDFFFLENMSSKKYPKFFKYPIFSHFCKKFTKSILISFS